MSAALRLPVVVDDGAAVRPRTRGECQDGERPCPWTSCAHHAIHGVLLGQGGGELTDDAVVELLTTMPETCTLDVADQGDAGTLEVVGNVWGITRERIRQIEAKALRRARRASEDLRADLSEDALPAALAKPAKPARRVRIDWMGEGDDHAETETAPAAMGAEETHVKVNVSRGLLTPPAPGARCAVPGCPDAPQAYQPKLPPELRGLCSRHRQRAQLWRADHKDKSAVEALTWLLAHPEPSARSGGVREAAQHVDTPPLVVPEAVRHEQFETEQGEAFAPDAHGSDGADVRALHAVAEGAERERDLAVAALARVREDLERAEAALRDRDAAMQGMREESDRLLAQRDAARAEAAELRRDRDALALAQQHAAERIEELEGQQLADAMARAPRPLARLAALVKALAPARETVAFEIEESSSPHSWRCAVHRGGELLDSWHHDSETPDDAVGVLVQRAEDIARVRIDELRIALEGA